MDQVQLQHKLENLNFFLIKFAKVFTKALLVLIIVLIISKAQINAQDSNAGLSEKIYLQLDGKVYTTGNIVWFKCIVSNAIDHVPSLLSGVLYVELITPAEKIFKKKLIKIENGIGQGFFYLDENLQEGIYQIRAYTQWNENFGSEFYFKEYIHVFAPKRDILKPISNVTLLKKQNNEYQLGACFYPLTIDSLHKNKLTVYISLDNKKDSLTLKRGNDDKYQMDYSITDKYQLATLQMQTSNQESYSKTILLNEDFLDLQFLPESGVLVHGLQNKIGFKSLDANGKGKMVQGDIIDELDSVVAFFKSNDLGMGSFLINKADSTKTYFARVISRSEENMINLYPLPHVSPIGNVLSITEQNNDVLVTAISNYIKDSIYLQISHRGVNDYYFKADLVDGIFKLSIPNVQLPDGIVAFTMYDKQMHPVAERLYFNIRPESRMQIALSTDKDAYAKRELTKLDIKTTNNNGEPIKANVSLLVINKEQMGKMQNMRQNILSYYLLDSELKGEIENPGFYFKNDSCSHSHLDALMLTQGWRKYLYSIPIKELSNAPEQRLSVSGQVNTIITKKQVKEAELNMITFGKNKSFYNEMTDSLGKFKFVLNDEYGEKINILIQSSKKGGQAKNYNISLNTKVSPPISFNQEKKIEKLDSTIKELVNNNIERKKIDDIFSSDDESVLLKEVSVQGYRMTPIRKQVMEDYGEPAEVIDGNEIREKEEKWSYGLYSVLLFNYPDKVRIERDSTGGMYAWVMGSDMTLVVIDGIPVMWYEYEFIPSIPPSEVSSFEIIKCAKDFDNLYCKVSPPRACDIPPHFPCGSVIAIYTHGKKGIASVTAPVGLTQTSVPVFCTPAEFYAPKYENVKSDDWNKPDLRALIHWEPVLKTDSNGVAHSTFYNADYNGKMQIVVEAISDNGEIGYQEIEYGVEGK